MSECDRATIAGPLCSMGSRSVSDGHDSGGESGIEGDGNQLADVKYMCFACEQYD
mgnify:FL=1